MLNEVLNEMCLMMYANAGQMNSCLAFYVSLLVISWLTRPASIWSEEKKHLCQNGAIFVHFLELKGLMVEHNLKYPQNQMATSNRKDNQEHQFWAKISNSFKTHRLMNKYSVNRRSIKNKVNKTASENLACTFHELMKSRKTFDLKLWYFPMGN